MATKKTGKQVAVRTGSKALVNWKERLKERAKEELARTPAATSNFVTLDKKGNFNHGGAQIGQAIEIVLLDHVVIKEYYDSEFDKDNPSAPACGLVSRSGKNMAPSSESPVPQAKICAECWANEFNSAKGGTRKGKACGDKRKIAFLMADELDLENPEIYQMRLSVTSNPPLNKHIRKVNEGMDLPTFAVITKVTPDTTVDWEKCQFEVVSEVDEQYIEMLEQKNTEAIKLLDQPMDFSSYRKPAQAKAARGKPENKKRSRVS